jgi:hypothetical protein
VPRISQITRPTVNTKPIPYTIAAISHPFITSQSAEFFHLHGRENIPYLYHIIRIRKRQREGEGVC